MASEIAMPREPGVSGKRSRNACPACVVSDGDGANVAPKVPTGTRRYGLLSYVLSTFENA
jgi:hypothetical protein